MKILGKQIQVDTSGIATHNVSLQPDGNLIRTPLADNQKVKGLARWYAGLEKNDDDVWEFSGGFNTTPNSVAGLTIVGSNIVIPSNKVYKVSLEYHSFTDDFSLPIRFSARIFNTLTNQTILFVSSLFGEDEKTFSATYSSVFRPTAPGNVSIGIQFSGDWDTTPSSSGETRGFITIDELNV